MHQTMWGTRCRDATVRLRTTMGSAVDEVAVARAVEHVVVGCRNGKRGSSLADSAGTV